MNVAAHEVFLRLFDGAEEEVGTYDQDPWSEESIEERWAQWAIAKANGGGGPVRFWARFRELNARRTRA